jgi:transposase InsO family protein
VPSDFEHGLSAVTPSWPRGLTIPSIPPAATLRAAQLADPDIGDVLRYIEGNRDDLQAFTIPRLRAQAAHYVVVDGVLHRLGDLFDPSLPVTHRTAIPRSLQYAVARDAHCGSTGGHIGATKLAGALRRRFYWLGQFRTAQKVVKDCMRCVANKARLAARTALRQPMLSERPWFHVHIDLWQPGVVSSDGHKYVLTVIDRMTHFPEMIPIKDKSAETVATAFFEHVICRHGVPAVVVSDNGSEFDGVFDALTRRYGIRRIRTSPYHPQANGICERLHGFMRGSLAAMSTDDQTEWHHHLPVTAFAYRSTPVARLGMTPFFLMHGREAVIPGELRAGGGSRSPTPIDEYVTTLQHRLQHAYCRARELEIQEKSKRLSQATYIPDEPFEVGDKVLLRRVVVDASESHKLTPRWEPQVVISARHPNYRVQDAAGRVSKCIVKLLRADHTAPDTYGDHVPDQPDSDATAPETAAQTIDVESLVIVTSDRADEPWCLARVRGVATRPGHIKIHYYNRGNKASSPDVWRWRPAYVDPRDGVDVLTYTPASRLQPYHRTIPLAKVILADVRLTKAGSICTADLRRINDSDRTPWVFRKRHGPSDPTPGVGTKVSKLFGKHGTFVGDVLSRRTDVDGSELFRIQYTDGDVEEMSLEELHQHAAQYDRSAARHTATAPQPSTSRLASKRARRAAARRPARSSEAERSSSARSARRASRTTR